MRYTPHSEEEILSMNIIEEGTYTFQVIETITVDNYGSKLQDKNGNEMAKLKLIVWDKDGRERPLSTYISGDSRFAYKLRHLAQTIGMVAEYEAGTLDLHHAVGKSGKAHIVIKKGTLKNDGSGEMWQDRNDVKDFVVNDQSTASPNPQVKDDLSDDVPF